MRTEIFNSYEEFKNRPDKIVNGVTQQFIDDIKFIDYGYDYLDDNQTNSGCWCCQYCVDCKNCDKTLGCVECQECIECIDCRYCYRIKNGYDARKCEGI